MQRYRSLLFVLLYGLSHVYGQQLPNKQDVSVWAPNKVEIDGKADEWGTLKAHNSATNLYYTLANDANNLYLVVQASDPRVIEKILDVGVSLTIGEKGKKQKNDPEILYPNIYYTYVRGILVNAGTKANWSGRPLRAGGPKETLTRTDSSVLKANNVFTAQAQQIKVFHLKGIADTAISVNNPLQIIAKAVFDIKGIYTYEVVIPLKYLISLNGTTQRFTYRIALKDWENAMYSTYRDPETRETRDADPDINSTKDFFGEYTLAKAP